MTTSVDINNIMLIVDTATGTVTDSIKVVCEDCELDGVSI